MWVGSANLLIFKARAIRKFVNTYLTVDTLPTVGMLPAGGNCIRGNLSYAYTEKNLLVNFTIFIKKFIIFLVTLGHTQNLGFLLF